MFTNPSIFGPGMWYKIHSDAIVCTTLTLKQSFAFNMNALCNNFKCLECKGHFRQFLDTHPIQNYFNIIDKGKDVGIFKWSWEFHNHVNQRLNKPLLNFEESYNLYKPLIVRKIGCTTCRKNILKK